MPNSPHLRGWEHIIIYFVILSFAQNKDDSFSLKSFGDWKIMCTFATIYIPISMGHNMILNE